jgi:hypothetical protein
MVRVGLVVVLWLGLVVAGCGGYEECTHHDEKCVGSVMWRCDYSDLTKSWTRGWIRQKDCAPKACVVGGQDTGGVTKVYCL